MTTWPKRIDRQRRLHATLLDAVEQAVIATDLSRRVIFWNAFAERLYGWSAAEAINRKLEDLMGPDELESVSSRITAQVLGGFRWSGEFTRKRRDGTTFPVHLTVSPIYDQDGTLAGGVGVSFDVSERRRADEDHERLAAIVASTDDAIVASLLDGTVMNWNRGAERLYGYSASEVVGREIGVVVPPDRRGELQQIAKRLRQGERIEHFETQRIRKDGRTIDVSIGCSPLHDAAGNVVAAAIIGRDITAKKLSERLVQDSEQRLRSLFMQHPDAVFAMDLDGRYTDLNPACERLSGFPSEELLGRVFGDRADSPDQARRALQIAVSGTPLTFDHALVTRDDQLVPVQVTLVPIIVNGATVGVYGIAKNIAERKHAEELLAMYARHQTAVADLGLLALTDIALETVLATAVKMVSAVLDVEVAAVLDLVPESELLRLKVGVGFPEAMIASRTFSAHDGSFLDCVLEVGDCVCFGALAGAEPFDEALFADLGVLAGLAIRLTGREHHNGVLVACTRRSREFSEDEQTFFQAIANALGAAIDRQNTADDLRRREHEFKILVEHAADSIVRMDRELRFMYVNPAAERTLGVSASSLVGRTNRSLGLPEPIVGSLERVLRRVFRTGEEDEFEFTYPSPGGDRHFHVRISPEFGPDGSVNSVLGIGRDITLNKQREAERAQIYQELLERDTRLHELVERVLLNQQAAQPGRSRLQSTSVAEQFTKRERQILRLLARGLTNRQIAQEINLSPSTVKNYIASLLPRLNATDRTQAAVLAAGLGLLDDEQPSA